MQQKAPTEEGNMQFRPGDLFVIRKGWRITSARPDYQQVGFGDDDREPGMTYHKGYVELDADEAEFCRDARRIAQRLWPRASGRRVCGAFRERDLSPPRSRALALRPPSRTLEALLVANAPA